MDIKKCARRGQNRCKVNNPLATKNTKEHEENKIIKKHIMKNFGRCRKGLAAPPYINMLLTVWL
jgi:hypothetical protein